MHENKISTGVLVVCVAVVLLLLYLLPLHIHKENDAETMVASVVDGYALIAKQQGIGLETFFKESPLLEDSKNEDKMYSFATPRKRFWLEHAAKAHSLIIVLYYPFVRLFGVTTNALEYYSICYMMIALLVLFLMLRKYYGQVIALISVAFLLVNLTWLIHIKVAGIQWMPSLILLLVLMWSLMEYVTSKSLRYIFISSVCLGLLYTIAWLSFAFGLISALTVMLLFVKRLGKRIVLDGFLLSFAAAGVAFIFVSVYCLGYGLDFIDTNRNIIDVYTERFNQGYSPTQSYGVSAKILYALKCIFIDMTQIDHLDKCLEGHPAVTPFLWIFMIIGLVYSIIRGKIEDKIILIFSGVVFVLLFTAYMYSNRYFIMVLPLLCVFGAIGLKTIIQKIWEWKKVVGVIATVLILALYIREVYSTYNGYYDEYMTRKKPGFEIDRQRGHGLFVAWLKENYKPEDVIIVLNDQVMFGSSWFTFYTFNTGFRYKYWVNYINENTKKEDFDRWETDLLKDHKRIIYAFSSVMLGGDNGRAWNDWSLFRAAHSDLQPVFDYSYAGRPTSFYVFVVERK